MVAPITPVPAVASRVGEPQAAVEADGAHVEIKHPQPHAFQAQPVKAVLQQQVHGLATNALAPQVGHANLNETLRLGAAVLVVLEANVPHVLPVPQDGERQAARVFEELLNVPLGGFRRGHTVHGIFRPGHQHREPHQVRLAHPLANTVCVRLLERTQ
jgi:hypothetical protein